MRFLVQRSVLALAAAIGLLGTRPATANAQKALVYCPVAIDATGCTAIVNALTGPAYPLGVERGYDGTGGTVDLKTVDLFTYSVVVVPSLADDATTQPYAKLRDPEVVEHLRAALIGRIAMWSGSPDQGATNRTMKDALIQNLAGWAGGAFGMAKGPGLVALLDASATATSRYDWVRAIAPAQVTADANLLIYSSVRALNPRATQILTSGAGPIVYDNMATFGYQVPNGAPGVSLDAVGQTGTAQGGQVVLLTMEAGNTTGALVRTDRYDYAPGETVTITGSGWQAGETVKLSLHMDPLRDSDTELTVTADANGNFTNTDFAPAEYDLGVRFVLTAIGQASGRRAQTTFTDSRTITSATLNGGTTVTVSGGENITAVVNVTTDNGGGNSNWRSTGWRIDTTAPGTVTCVNHVNHDGAGSYSETFSITAPAAVGTDNAYFIAYSNDTCSNQPSGTLTLTNSVVVVGNPTITTISPNPKTYGDAGFTLTVSGTNFTATSTVRFNGADRATTFVNGTQLTASILSTDLLAVGSFPITVRNGAGVLSNAVNLTVNQKTLAGGFTASNKVYDGGNSATILTRTLTGVVGTDAVNLTGGTATFGDKTVGAGKTVTGSGFTLSGAQSANYTLASTTLTTTADITVATLTGAFTAQNKTYDGTTAATIATRSVTGAISPDVVTLTGGTAAFADKNVGTGKTVTGTGFTLGGADAGNYVLASLTLTTTADITARALAVTGTGVNKGYDATTAATVTLSDDRIVGDIFTTSYTTATFADKNVGTAKSINVTGIAISGADAANYLPNTTCIATADITAKSLTGSFTADNKVYDGTTAATISGRSFTPSAFAGDVVSLTGGTATFGDKNIGTGKTVTGTGFSLTGADAGNYALASSSLTTTANITTRALTISAAGINKIYDGTNAASVNLTDDRVSGDVFTDVYGSASFADKNVGTAKTVNVTGISITGTDAGNYTFNTTASATADITARALAVSATGVNKVYDGNATATVTLSDDRVAGDVLTDSYTSATFVDKNVGTGKSVNVTGISISGTDAGNYTFNTTTATTANITSRSLAVTATGIDKVYDGTIAATVTFADDRVSGDVFTVTGSATFADKNVGNGKTVNVTGIALSGTDAGNYSHNLSTSTTANITQRALTVSATGVNRVYDGTTNATVTLSDDRVAGDVLSTAYASASFADKNAGPGKSVSVSGISVTGADAGNYSFNTTAATTANITARALVVTATGVDKVYDGATTATVTLGDDRLAGDVFTASYATATFADKNVGSNKPITVGGISLGGADAGNYAPNTTASATANITARALTVIAAGVNKVYDGTTTATVNLTDNRVAGDNLTLAYVGASFADKNVGAAKPVSVSGIGVTGADAGNYTFNTTANTIADITVRTLVVSATAQDKEYDGTATASVTLADDRVTGDAVTVSFSSATFANKNVGTAKTVTISGIALSGVDANNYAPNATATTTASITARALVVSATGVNKIYDGTTTATVTLADNRVSGDVFTDAYASATFADKNVGAAKAISVTGISISGTDAGNYTHNTTASATADITARALTVSATAANKVYDGTTAASVTLSDDRVAGDALTSAYGSAAFSDKNAGLAKTVTVTGISIGGADAGNYTFNTTTTTTADITKRGLTISAAGVNKVYDGITAATVSLSDDRLSGDVFTDSYGTANFADKNVGTSKTISVSGISIAGTDAGNYTFNTSASATADITARALVIAASGVNRTYDGTTTATVTLSDDRISGDVLTDSYTSALFGDKNVGTAKPVSVSGIALSGADAGNYTFNTTANTTADITPATVTGSFAAANKVYDGGTTATIVDRGLSGVITPDVVSLTGGSATFGDKNVGTGKTVTGTGFTLSAGDGANYILASTTLTTAADITQRSLVVTATGINKVYDGTTSATVSLADNRVAGDAITTSYTGAAFADKNVGNAKAVSVVGISTGGADAGNYTVNTTAMTTANITAKALTVSATGIDKVYDGNANATVSLSDDRVAGDVLTLAYSGALFNDKQVGTSKPVSVSGISVTGTDAGNYTFNMTAATTANIAQRTLAISAAGVNKVYDGNDGATVNLSDDRVAGDAFTTSYTAVFNNRNVGTAKPVSVSAISISGPDAGNYSHNATASTSADITARVLTVSAAAQNKVYDATNAATVVLSDDRVVGDALTIGFVSATFSDKNVANGKTVTVSTIAVTGGDAGNYTFNTTATALANITPRSLAVSATAQNKIYDGNASATVTLADNRLSGDVFTANHSSAVFSDKNVGTGKTVTVSGISLSGLDADNYAPNASTTTTADITTRALAVTATGVNKIYDATVAATVTLADNRVAGDALTTTYASATFGDANVGVMKTVSVSGILVGGADATNYTSNTTTTTTANISARPLAIKADDKTMAFGGATPAFTATGDNFAGAEGFGNLTGTIQFATSPVSPITASTFAGTYTITPSSVTSTNYAITFQTGTLTITDGKNPIASNTLVLPVPTGGTAVLTSTISDELTGHTNISSAWYSINGGPLMPMTAADGAFDSFTENVKATITAPTTTGVLSVCVTGRDALPPANVSNSDCVLLAVYDPNAGFVTGGGWIDSPPGAYVTAPALTGKATFGFVSKYKKGQSTPDGSTEFQFHAAGMNFKSTVYEWLVVSGARAQFKGTGTINGAGNYGFLLTAIDGQVNGGGGADKFRIKIWDIAAGGTIVYDNNIAASDTADPTTLLGGGSINIQAK